MYVSSPNLVTGITTSVSFSSKNGGARASPRRNINITNNLNRNTLKATVALKKNNIVQNNPKQPPQLLINTNSVENGLNQVDGQTSSNSSSSVSPIELRNGNFRAGSGSPKAPNLNNFATRSMNSNFTNNELYGNSNDIKENYYNQFKKQTRFDERSKSSTSMLFTYESMNFYL